MHFKPPGLRTVNFRTVQHACKVDEGIINAVCEEEKLLTGPQAKHRVEWVNEQLPLRPHSKDWEDIAFCV